MKIDIKNKKTKICITDLKKYREVAAFLDKPAFIEDVSKIRVFLNIATPVLYENVPLWEMNQPKTGFNAKDAILAKEKVDSLLEIDRKQAVVINNLIEGKRYILEFIHALEYKYNKIGFSEIIKYAIIAGVITDHELELETIAKEMARLSGRVVSNKVPDTADEIKRDRDWYWRNLAGESYAKISKNDDLPDRSTTVKQAMIAYKKLIR